MLTAPTDFDDAPKLNEKRGSIFDHDSDLWHSHWVTIMKYEECGLGA